MYTPRNNNAKITSEIPKGYALVLLSLLISSCLQYGASLFVGVDMIW